MATPALRLSSWRRHPAVKAGGYRALTFVVSALFLAVTTRLTIDGVGVRGYACVALVASLLALIPFADLGVGAAITNAVAGDVETAESVLRTSVRVLCISGLIVVSVGVAGAGVHVWHRLLGVASPLADSVDVAVAVALSIFGATLPLGSAARVLVGAGRTDLLVLCQAVGAPVAMTIAICAHVFGASLWLYCAAAPAGALIAGCLCSTAAGRLTGFNLIRLLREVPRVRTAPGASIRRAAGPMFVVMVGLPLALQSDRIVLSHRAALASVAIYSLCAQLYGPMWAVVSTSGSTLWPIFINSRGTTGARLLRRMVVAFTGVGMLMGLLLIALGPLAAGPLSSGRLTLGIGLLACFAAMLISQSGHLPSGMYLTSESDLGFQAKCVVAMLLVNLVVSWWLAGTIGAAGPAMASAVSVALCQWLPCFLRATRGGARGPVVREA